MPNILYLTTIVFIFLIRCTNHRYFFAYAQIGKSGDVYCDSTNTQFSNDCNSRFTDSGQNDFCSTYGIRCRGWIKANQPRLVVQQNQLVVAEKQQPVVVEQQVAPKQQFVLLQNLKPQMYAKQHAKLPSSDSVAYCQAHGKDYYTLCLQGSVPDFSRAFCNGFSDVCPGVPKPGALVGNLVPSLYPQKSSMRAAQQPVPMSSIPYTNQGFSQAHEQMGAVPMSSPTGMRMANSMGSMPMGSPMGAPPGAMPMSSPTGMRMDNSMGSMPMGSPMGAPPGGLAAGQSVHTPFYDGQRATNLSPSSGFGNGQKMSIAGIDLGESHGVNYNIPFLKDLGIPFLDGRKRRRRQQKFARNLKYLVE